MYSLADSVSRSLVLALAFFWSFTDTAAQNNCDCINSRQVQKGETQVFGNSGIGKLMEISDSDPKSLYYFEKEHNVSWFKFEIREDVNITFELAPDNPADDIDFILFKYDMDGFCDRVKQKKVKPLRSNLARSGSVNGGITGLSHDAADEFVHSGPGNTRSKSCPAKKGEVFYLVVDNVSSAGKFSIMLDDGSKPRTPSTVDASPISAEGYVEIKTPFEIRIVDDESGLPVTATLDVAGYQIGEPFHAEDSAVYLLHMSSSQSVTINCNAKGYLFFTQAIMAPIVPYDAVKAPDKFLFEVRLKKLKPGEAVRLPNIKFKGDETEILPSSRASLLTLYKFMLENPTAVIEIEGHVNAPGMKNSSKIKKLSKDRAKAVFEYLVEKGIEPSRIQYKGYGNSKMVYKKPANEKQNEENRRVEIRVIAI
ncbi:MAG: OmpA family protein [Bacteroidota bacterium]